MSNDDLYDVIKAVYHGEHMPEMGSRERQEEMRQQLRQMRDNGKKWLEEHPASKVMIAFTKPSGHQVIAAIDDALDAQIVKVSPDGLALINALWPIHAQDAPTITMTRVVVEDLIQ